jgi:Rnl2 family RNA ligase
MSNFKKYDSITNHYQDKTIAYYQENGANDVLWEITEKVHGCNFSWIIDKGVIQYAQRSMVTDSIFGSHLDTPKYDEAMLALWKYIGKPIQVYGEYYGSGIVGKGEIAYFKEKKKDFIFFDIRLIEPNWFIDQKVVETLLANFNLPYVPVIKVCNFQEAITYNPETLKSQVSEIDTFVEGVVLKPTLEKRLPNGDRMIIKIISPQYRENKNTPVERKVIQEKIEQTQSQILTRDVVPNKLTEVRVGKVASKYGISVDDKSKFQLLQQELTNDIIEECQNIDGIIVDATTVKNLCIPIIKSFFNLTK